MKPNLTRSRVLQGGLLALLSLSFLGSLFARGATDPVPVRADNKYIGADKCKSCHSSADVGDQYGHWKTMKHAVAFETLAGEEAKKIAAAKGIADPQQAEACVKCHVTAFGVPEEDIKKGFNKAQGVQCETCHGPGEQHMKARFAAASKGDQAAGVQPGEIVALPKQDVCLGCHNDQSPSYKGFCYHEYSAKIRHLNPKKGRTEIDIGDCSCPKCANGCPEEHKALRKVQ